MDRKRFIETGKYDVDMDIWGGENFGMSRGHLFCTAAVKYLSQMWWEDVFTN